MQVLGCRRRRAGVRGDDRVSRLRSRGSEPRQTRAARVRAQTREHTQVPGLQVTAAVVLVVVLQKVASELHPKVRNHG